MLGFVRAGNPELRPRAMSPPVQRIISGGGVGDGPAVCATTAGNVAPNAFSDVRVNTCDYCIAGCNYDQITGALLEAHTEGGNHVHATHIGTQVRSSLPLAMVGSPPTPPASNIACICGAFGHDGKVMLDMAFDVPCMYLASAIFGDTGPRLHVLCSIKRGAQDMVANRWFAVNKPSHHHRRELAYILYIQNDVFGNIKTRALEHQILTCNNDHDGCVFEAMACTPDVPYGTKFSVHQTICISRTSANQTRMRVYAHIKFSQRMFLQEMIYATAMAGIADFVGMLKQLMIAQIDSVGVGGSISGSPSAWTPVSPLTASIATPVSTPPTGHHNADRMTYPELASRRSVDSGYQSIGTRVKPQGPRMPKPVDCAQSLPVKRITTLHQSQVVTGLSGKATYLDNMHTPAPYLHDCHHPNLNGELKHTPHVSASSAASTITPCATVPPGFPQLSSGDRIAIPPLRNRGGNKRTSTIPAVSHQSPAVFEIQMRELAVWDGSRWTKAIRPHLSAPPPTPELPKRTLRLRDRVSKNGVPATSSPRNAKSFSPSRADVSFVSLPGDWYMVNHPRQTPTTKTTSQCLSNNCACNTNDAISSRVLYRIVIIESLKQLVVPIVIRIIGVSGILNILWIVIRFVFLAMMWVVDVVMDMVSRSGLVASQYGQTDIAVVSGKGVLIGS